MKELDELMRRVDSVHKSILKQKEEAWERFGHPEVTISEMEDIHDDLTELERKEIDIDNDWIFLTEYKESGTCPDMGTYKGIINNYSYYYDDRIN